MRNEFIAIEQNDLPLMKLHSLQYALDAYANETNKVVSTWREFADSDLGFAFRFQCFDEGSFRFGIRI